MKDCIFCKIAKKELPAKFVYEDEEVMVFPDIKPLKPIHLLVVPKQHIRDFLDLSDDVLLAKIRVVIQKMVKEQKLDTNGFRLTMHGGGAQVIDHLHIHILGPMGKAASL